MKRMARFFVRLWKRYFQRETLAIVFYINIDQLKEITEAAESRQIGISDFIQELAFNQLTESLRKKSEFIKYEITYNTGETSIDKILQVSAKISVKPIINNDKTLPSF